MNLFSSFVFCYKTLKIDKAFQQGIAWQDGSYDGQDNKKN